MTDDFLTRLKIERDELLDRHNKLQAFLREGVFRLPLNQQFMLKLQAGAMHQYLTILNAEDSLYKAQLQLVDAQRQEVGSIVNLYMALGGGWEAADKKAMAQDAANAAPQPAPRAATPVSVR